MPDPEDLLDPAALVQEAARHLLSALAAVEEISRSLRGESPPPRKPGCNVVPFLARPRHERRGRHAAQAGAKSQFTCS